MKKIKAKKVPTKEQIEDRENKSKIYRDAKEKEYKENWVGKFDNVKLK